MNIRKKINIPTPKPQRIFAYEPPHSRIIVPCPHVVKTVWFGHDPILTDTLEGLGNRFLLAEYLAEGVVGVAVHYVLVHVGERNGAACPVEMIAVSGRRCHYGEEAFAVDIFVGDPV